MLRTVHISLMLLLALMCAGRALAHDIGGLLVEVTLRPGGLVLVEVTADPSHLPPSLTPFPADRFLGGAALAADGHDLDIRLTKDHGPGPNPKFRGECVVPTGTRSLTWRQPLAVGQYPLIVYANNGAAKTLWISGADTGPPIALGNSGEPAPAPSVTAVLRQYLVLGFTHIVPEGLDHILFVLSLFLLSLRIKPLLMQVTAFTVAHSVTLGLAMAGVVSLPSSIVEPAIALSIAWMAIENILTDRCRPTRTVTVFLFGLLHGLGFAGVLAELGTPSERFAPALAAFNVGVELGQLSVVGTAMLLIGWPLGRRRWYRKYVVIPASALIALTGLYWTVERIVARP